MGQDGKMTDNKELRALKPCPFCGGEARLSDAESGVDGMGRLARNPRCYKCGADLGYCSDAGAATKAWNRRPAEDAKDARIAELEKAVVDLREALGPFARIDFKQRLLGAIGDRGDWDLETIDVQLRFLRKARKVYAQTSNAGGET